MTAGHLPVRCSRIEERQKGTTGTLDLLFQFSPVTPVGTEDSPYAAFEKPQGTPSPLWPDEILQREDRADENHATHMPGRDQPLPHEIEDQTGTETYPEKPRHPASADYVVQKIGQLCMEQTAVETGA